MIDLMHLMDLPCLSNLSFPHDIPHFGAREGDVVTGGLVDVIDVSETQSPTDPLNATMRRSPLKGVN